MKLISEFVKHFRSEILVESVFDPKAFLTRDKTYFAVVDKSVDLFFGRNLKNWVKSAMVLDNVGESLKTQDTVDQITDFLEDVGADRLSTLIAVGGGVLLDIAGEAAAKHMRGIDWITIPTTLLSMVDASLGGKTAVNSRRAKNIKGSFHLPVYVVVTPAASGTWNQTHRLEGLAEMYKILRIFDISAARQLVQNPDDFRFVERSIELKDAVVRADPWEKNIRAALNCGHTFGHAFEHSLGLRHGLAVGALGIPCENRALENMGLMSAATRERIDEDLKHLGFTIPAKLPPFRLLMEHIKFDKKNRNGQIRLFATNGLKDWDISCVDPTKPVSVDCLQKAYNTFCEANNVSIE